MGTYQLVPFNTFKTICNHAFRVTLMLKKREMKKLYSSVTIRLGAFKSEMENTNSTIFKSITDKSIH